MFPPTWFAAWMNHRRAKIGLRKSGIAEALVMSRGYGYRRGSALLVGVSSEFEPVSPSPQELTEAEPGPPCVALEGPLDVEPVIRPDLRHERWVADQHDGERRPADPEGRPVRGPVTHARELGQRLGRPSQVVGRELRPLRPRLLRRLSRRHRWSRGRRLCSLPFGAAYRWELVSGGYAPCGHIHHPRYVRNGHTAAGCPPRRMRRRAGGCIDRRRRCRDRCGVFDGVFERDGLSLASRPQLYVDLVRRGGAAAEAAAFIRERSVLWQP